MAFKCLECATPVGFDAGNDPYRHAISCFSLPDRGILHHYNESKKDDTLRGQRIFAIMAYALDEAKRLGTVGK
jgi:hypothetical protein